MYPVVHLKVGNGGFLPRGRERRKGSANGSLFLDGGWWYDGGSSRGGKKEQEEEEEEGCGEGKLENGENKQA